MKTTITIREMASIKRTAQNSNANVVKKNKIASKIEALQKEYEDLVKAIEADEAGIMMRFGHTSEELVEKVVTTTDKTDKDGNPIKVTKYVPREDKVTYNEEKKYYEILPDTQFVAEMPAMGNDYDEDVKVAETTKADSDYFMD